jgi:hypothetical protein
MNALGMQKYLLLLGMIVSISTFGAADTVAMPGCLDDLSEYYVQLFKALDQEFNLGIGMVDINECMAFVILSGNARLCLKDRAWPALRYVKKGSDYCMQISERRRRERCGLPDLKKTFDAIITNVKHGWKKQSESSDGWSFFGKEKRIEEEVLFIKSVSEMLDLNIAVSLDHSGMLSLQIRQDDMQTVQEKMGFQFE